MVMWQRAREALGVVVAAAVLVGVTGCDYWPPALQAEIEQLRSETQTLTLEKTQLQTQVAELSRTRQDLQIQVDDLSRVNREKSGMITSLQSQVEQLRARAVKATVPKTAAKSPAKTTAKPTAKSTGKRPAKKKAVARKA